MLASQFSNDTFQVVCRELGLRYAHSAAQTYQFSPTSDWSANSSVEPSLTGVRCLGNEETLHDCGHDLDTFCPGDGARDVAAVVCVEEQADLEPDLYELMSSAHLEDKQLFYMQVT